MLCIFWALLSWLRWSRPDGKGHLCCPGFACKGSTVCGSPRVLRALDLVAKPLVCHSQPQCTSFCHLRARSTLSGGRFSGGTGVRYRCRGSRLSTWKCRPTYCGRPSAWPWGSGDLGFRLCASQRLWLENSVEIWLANLPALALAAQASIRRSRLLPCLLWNWGLYKELANGSSTPAFHRSWIDCQESIFPHGWQRRFMSFTCISRHPGHCMDPSSRLRRWDRRFGDAGWAAHDADGFGLGGCQSPAAIGGSSPLCSLSAVNAFAWAISSWGTGISQIIIDTIGILRVAAVNDVNVLWFWYILIHYVLYINDNNHDNRTDNNDKVMNIMTLIHCDGYVRWQFMKMTRGFLLEAAPAARLSWAGVSSWRLCGAVCPNPVWPLQLLCNHTAGARTHAHTLWHTCTQHTILHNKGAGRCREPPNRCAVVAAAFALRCDHLHARGQVARWISLDSLGMIARYWTCWPYYIILLCIQILDTNCSYSICAASRVAAIVASGAGTVVVSWYLPGGWDMMCYKYPAVWIESSDILLLCILDVSLIPLHRGGVHHNNYIYTRDNQHILRAPRIQLRNWLADSAAVSIAGPGPCLPANYRSKDSSIHSDYAGGIHWQCNLQ